MKNIGIQHFRLVHAIVKEGTLTKAAEMLYLTQSALSHQLKELEKELNIPVFYRKGRKLELTDEGTRFLDSADKILTELSLLESDLLHIRDGESGSLKIITQCYTAYHWLPRIIKYYKSVSPGIDIHVVSAATQQPLDFLLRGELDVAIVRNKIDNPSIHYEPIFEDRLYAVLSNNHPLAKKQSFSGSDFHDQDLFLHFIDPSSNSVPVIENLMKACQAKPRHLHRIHYTDAIIEMVNANMGITVLADWIIQPYLETRDIVIKPLPAEVAKRTWYAATCKHNVPIKNFLDCLKYHFSEMTMKISAEHPVERVPLQVAV
ncbi:transcriptional regulator, LysR family [Russula earlei]|uniref:Transcriptional regulator, LysR family n=1 Tax=Russula earlei TaxID=71964 RepID=A0ACC0TXA7_9AGAM|nr:transcriptional regulator, LysR family [Russula earlei]